MAHNIARLLPASGLLLTALASAQSFYPSEDFRGFRSKDNAYVRVGDFYDVDPHSIWIMLGPQSQPIQSIRFFHPSVSCGSDIEVSILASTTTDTIAARNAMTHAQWAHQNPTTTCIDRRWITFNAVEDWLLDPDLAPDRSTLIQFTHPFPATQDNVVLELQLHDWRNYANAQHPDRTFLYDDGRLNFRAYSGRGGFRAKFWEEICGPFDDPYRWSGSLGDGHDLSVYSQLWPPEPATLFLIGLFHRPGFPSLAGCRTYVIPVLGSVIALQDNTVRVGSIPRDNALRGIQVAIQGICFDHQFQPTQWLRPELHTVPPIVQARTCLIIQPNRTALMPVIEINQ